MPLYNKTIWNDGAAPGISAPRLNKIEQGIADALPMDGTGAMTGKLAMGADLYSLIQRSGGDLMLNSANGWYMMSANAKNVGGVWNRIDTGIGASRLDLRFDGTMVLFKAPAGANPIVWDGGSIVWNIGNDGSGSGSDADMLDGLHSSSFVTKNNYLGTGFDFNTVVDSGFYRMDSPGSNGPPTSVAYGQLLVMHGGGDTITQIATSYGNSIIFMRSGNPTNVGGSGSWGSWYQIMTSAQTVQTRSSSGYLEWYNGSAWMPAGGIKNVQRGIFTLPQDGATSTFNITISSVNMAKTFVNVNYVYESGASASSRPMRYRLTTATNLEIFRGSGMYDPTNGAYEVIEFY